MFGRMFGENCPVLGSFNTQWLPSVDVRQENGNLIVKADLLMHRVPRETGVAFVMVTPDDRLARAADRIL